MNEKYKQLGSEAGMYVDLKGSPWPKWMGAEECEVAYKTFAELVVRECISVVENLSPGYDDYRNQIEDAFRRDCVEQLKSHFDLS